MNAKNINLIFLLILVQVLNMDLKKKMSENDVLVPTVTIQHLKVLQHV